MLALHGVSHAVVLPIVTEALATDAAGQTVARFHANVDVNRHDFGLAWRQPPESVRIGDRVRIVLDIVAVRGPASEDGSVQSA